MDYSSRKLPSFSIVVPSAIRIEICGKPLELSQLSLDTARTDNESVSGSESSDDSFIDQIAATNSTLPGMTYMYNP